MIGQTDRVPDDPRYRCRHEEWTVDPADFVAIDSAGNVTLAPGAKKVCLICGCGDVDGDLIRRAQHPAGQAQPQPKVDPVTLHRPAGRGPLEPVSKKDVIVLAALGTAALAVAVAVALSYRGVVTI